MTTSVTAAGRPAPGGTAVEWLTQWVKDHKRAAAYIAAVLAIAAALFVWNLLSTRTAERSAGRQLEQGRLALASRNYQLAASVLSQVTENYAGTHADRKSTRLNSSHLVISYAVFCLKKKRSPSEPSGESARTRQSRPSPEPHRNANGTRARGDNGVAGHACTTVTRPRPSSRLGGAVV